MSELSKDYVVRMAAKAHAKGYHCGPPVEGSQFFTPTQLQHFAVLICADLVAENERLREQIKCGHSMELDSLARERDELLAENERMLAANRDCIDHFNAAMEDLGAAQAKIDSLMLEYCPDEMTPEQIENWGKHQKAVSDQTNLPLRLSP